MCWLVARLRQYGSTLSLADYVVQDPTRFAQGTMRQAGVHASSGFFFPRLLPLACAAAAGTSALAFVFWIVP